MNILGTDKGSHKILLSTDTYKKGSLITTSVKGEHILSKVVSWVRNEEGIGCIYLLESALSTSELYKAKFHYNNLIDMGLINGIKFKL